MPRNTTLFALLACAVLPACSVLQSVQSIMPNRLLPAPEGTTAEELAAPDPGAAAATGTDAAATADTDAAPDATPEQAAEAEPAFRTSNAWRRDLSPRVPYYNLANALVPVYADIALTERAGMLGPGEGGRIETCRADAAICRIDTGTGEPVWVEIANLSAVDG